MLSSVLTPKSIWSYNPYPTGCVLYLPLWHPSCYGTVFKSIDMARFDFTRTGGVMGEDGFTADGDDYITCGDQAKLDLTSELTLMAWHKGTHGAASLDAILAKWQTAQYYLAVFQKKIRGLAKVDSGTDTGGSSTGAALTDNVWYMSTYTMKTGAQVLYQDTTSVFSGSVAYTTIDTQATPFNVGARTDVPGNYYTGTIAEAWVFDKYLSSDEVTYIYGRTRAGRK